VRREVWHRARRVGRQPSQQHRVIALGVVVFEAVPGGERDGGGLLNGHAHPHALTLGRADLRHGRVELRAEVGGERAYAQRDRRAREARLAPSDAPAARAGAERPRVPGCCTT